MNYSLGYNFSDPIVSKFYESWIKHLSDSYELNTLIKEKYTIKEKTKDEFYEIIKGHFDEIHYDLQQFICLKDDYIVKFKIINKSPFTNVTAFIFLPSFEKKNEVVSFIDNILKNQKSNTEFFKITWKWEGGSKEISEMIDDEIHEEAYPFFEDLDEWIKNYFTSKESVTILRGEAGSGKTRLIRHILRKYYRRYGSASVLYTTDDNLLMQDGFFVDLLDSSYDILVLEDLDQFLTSRLEGNNSMNKLLTISDGLVQTINKKIIITTNLPNIRDFDKALLRSGRCYDHVNFRKLTQKEAKQAAKKIDPNFDTSKLTKEKYVLSDIYKTINNPEQNLHKNGKKEVGFK